MPASQEHNELKIFTPLGKDVVLLHGFTITEELGRLFTVNVELASTQNIEFEQLLGENVTLSLNLTVGKRFFNGYVSSISQGVNEGSFARYSATIRPWFWFLTRTSDCRIFQNQTVPEIIKLVCNESGFTDIKDNLTGNYPAREYIVQFRETDFNFLSRLMEDVGCYYYFSHFEGSHTMILADDYASHELNLGKIPYYPPNETAVRDEEYISNWFFRKRIQPGTCALNDYNPLLPQADLQVGATVARTHSQADYEVYDAPGAYDNSSDGEAYAKKRIQELHAQYGQAQGQGIVRELSSGCLFSLTHFPRADQNCEQLVVSLTHTMHIADFESDRSAESAAAYANDFTAIESSTPYRSPRITPKPVVQGLQTAVVVGPSGEEIYTDEHGRIKVQFHWDRYGEFNENSSCWIRVSQVHAGKGFGGVDIPRIGEEVVVSFEEGDLDRPLVIGRVYNGDNKAPNGLPAAKMVSGLKSNTTPGGGGNNSIMLDDTKSKEGLTIHAQYNMDTTVENDQSNTVKNDFTEIITNNASITISEGTYNHDVAANTATYHVKGALTENYDDVQTTTVNKDITIKSVTSQVLVDASTVIKLHVGSSTIEMDAGGNIKIDGVNITINGSASVAIKGGLVSSTADSKNETKGAVVISDASAANTVKGGTVLLNP